MSAVSQPSRSPHAASQPCTAKDPKALSAWYNDRFGLPMKGEMPGGAYGGFEWNGTSFNIAIVAAGYDVAERRGFEPTNGRE